MEVVGADDDLGPIGRDALHLIAPFAGHLEGALHRLDAGVHRQHRMGAGKGADLLVEETELIVAEGAGGEGEASRLLDHRRQNLRVTMALVHR